MLWVGRVPVPLSNIDVVPFLSADEVTSIFEERVTLIVVVVEACADFGRATTRAFFAI